MRSGDTAVGQRITVSVTIARQDHSQRVPGPKRSDEVQQQQKTIETFLCGRMFCNVLLDRERNGRSRHYIKL